MSFLSPPLSVFNLCPINSFAAAGSGIGKACALAFAKEGAAGVVFVDLNLRFAEEAAAESRELATHPKYKALALSADVTSETQVDSTVAATIQEFGQINYAVNSAGVGSFCFILFILDLTLSSFRSVCKIQQKSQMRLFRNLLVFSMSTSWEPFWSREPSLK